MAWVLIIFASVSVLAVIVVFPGIRARERREKHVRGRTELSDAAFVAQMGIVFAHRDAYLAVRRAMAKAAGVPPETIHPDDQMEHLCSLGFDGIDTIEIIMELENELRASFRDDACEEAFKGKVPMQMRFADFSGCLVAMIGHSNHSD